MNSPDEETSAQEKKQLTKGEGPRLRLIDLIGQFKARISLKKNDVYQVQRSLEELPVSPAEEVLVAQVTRALDELDDQILGLEEEAADELRQLRELEDSNARDGQTLSRFLAGNNIAPDPESMIRSADRAGYEQQINLEYIQRVAEPAEDYLLRKVHENQVVVLGEVHTLEMIEKGFFSALLQQAKNAGVTDIGIEVSEVHQDKVDKIQNAGKLDVDQFEITGEMCEEYIHLRRQSIILRNSGEDRVSREWLDNNHKKSDFRSSVKDLHFLESIDTFFSILEHATELGMCVHCIDYDYNYPEEEADKAIDEGRGDEYFMEREMWREEVLFTNIKSVVNGTTKKMLVLIGSAHVSTNGMPYENLADKLKKDISITSARVKVDRDIDTDKFLSENLSALREALEDPISLNSVLCSVLNNLNVDNVGFDLDDPRILKSATISDFSYDGYIKIAAT